MIYARIAAIVAALIGLGWWLGSRSWETKYNALQAENWKGEYQRQKDVADDLQRKLDDATATNQRNAGIIGDLHEKLSTADADHDKLTGQLRIALARTDRPASCGVPKATDQPRALATAQAPSDGPLAGLLSDAIAESNGNRLAQDALIAQLKPQLETKP